jgi:hypothetical protein
MANKLDIKIKMPSDAEINKMFNAVPILERHRVADQVVRAGSRAVVRKARALAPRSTTSGSVSKWSQKMYETGGTGDKGTPRKKGEIPLWKTIAVVVRKYHTNGTAIVGPKYNEGNKAYFNTGPSGRKQVLWGRVTGKTVPQLRNWIVQAFDETKSEQLAAMKKKLQQKMKEIWGG